MTIELDLLDSESVAEAVDAISELAKSNGIEWALAGGLATALHGGDLNTRDIENLANKFLPLDNKGLLSRGGKRYSIKTTRRDFSVDWILRNDSFKQLFEIALCEAVKINDVPVLTPEWLVILKFIAGRFKDQEDAVFLLSRKGLVNRSLIKEKIIKHISREANERVHHARGAELEQGPRHVSWCRTSPVPRASRQQLREHRTSGSQRRSPP